MELPKRRRNRLKNYEYSQPGYYFVTICTANKMRVLCRGEHCSPGSGGFLLSEQGEVLDRAIHNIGQHYQTVIVDKYVIMPNHAHIILRLLPNHGRTMCAPTVSQIVKQLKEVTTKSLHCALWQKSFYDHIIRGETDYLRIWQYIDANPAKWREDCYYEG